MWRGLISTHRQAPKLILGPSLTATTRLLSFNMTQSRVVIGLLAGHNTLRRHLYITGLINSPLCRRCGAEEEISVHVLSVKPWLHSRHTYLGSYSWTQSKSGESGTSVKEWGSHDLDIRIWGTKGLPKRPMCIRTERARTSLLCYSILPSYNSSTVVFLSLKQSKIFTLAAL